VAGNGVSNDNPTIGSTITPGSSNSITVVVLSLASGKYKLGAWIFEGTNPDVMKPALDFWSGTPVEVQFSGPTTSTTTTTRTTTTSKTSTTSTTSEPPDRIDRD